MTVVVYGISNCDQIRKTLGWLTANRVEHRFHDYRRDGIDRQHLERWCSHVPWTALLNKRGQTWRNLAEERRRQIVDQATAIELLLENPTLVKRPVIEIDDDLLLGFSADRLREALARQSGATQPPEIDAASAPAADPAEVSPVPPADPSRP